MASYSGGDIVQITYNHPTLGTGSLYAKSMEDSTYDPGGFRSVDDANMIDGAGNAIHQINRVRWSFSVKLGWNPSRQDLETVAALAASTQEGTFTFINVNGTAYKGTGKMVGDVQANGNNSTLDIKASGSGTLEIL